MADPDIMIMRAMMAIFIILNSGINVESQDSDPSWFSCDDGQLISHGFVCDYHDDCEDLSDERNCTDDYNWAGACDMTKEHVCGNGYCLPFFKTCNGYNDCDDNSDEYNCPDITNSTCYHCYWYDEYNGGNDNALYEEFDSRGVEGAHTINCKDNLDLVPTIRCAGDCVTRDYVSDSAYSPKEGGFINYISRTCKDGEHPFEDTSHLERETCLTVGKFHHKQSMFIDTTLCRCSEDLCNSKPIQELDTTTCYICHYGTHNGSSDLDFNFAMFEYLPGPWLSSCDTPDPDSTPTILCPLDCGSFSFSYETPVDDINGTVEMRGRQCWHDYSLAKYKLANDSCYDVLNSPDNDTLWHDPEYLTWLHKIHCRCSDDYCGGMAEAVTISITLLILSTLIVILDILAGFY